MIIFSKREKTVPCKYMLFFALRTHQRPQNSAFEWKFSTTFSGILEIIFFKHELPSFLRCLKVNCLHGLKKRRSKALVQPLVSQQTRSKQVRKTLLIVVFDDASVLRWCMNPTCIYLHKVNNRNKCSK